MYNEVVIRGIFTREQIESIFGKLDLGGYFIPSQVGLPEKRFDKWTDDDHVWFELDEDDFEETDAAPTIQGITAEELYSNFMTVEWDENLALRHAYSIYGYDL